MHNKLQTILLKKLREVNELHHQLQQNPDHPVAAILQGELLDRQFPSFGKNLQSSGLSVIAEIKRKSPSKGELAAISNPLQLAKRYVSGGANALSILTDREFFNGSLDDLNQVSLNLNNIPIIRKDFILDQAQIAEAYVAGASAVLLIVAALHEKTAKLLEFAHSLRMDVLVEVHDADELKLALDAGADIIGINNRNLTTFEVDTKCALQLLPFIPDSVIKVAESGITEPALAREYHRAGFDAVLIGEALVKSDDPEQFIRECCHD